MWLFTESPNWNLDQYYRAVRVERAEGKRVPLPWSTMDLGMRIRSTVYKSGRHLINYVDEKVALSGSTVFTSRDMLSCEHLSGNEWLPLWTEETGEERIVEIVSEEET